MLNRAFLLAGAVVFVAGSAFAQTTAPAPGPAAAPPAAVAPASPAPEPALTKDGKPRMKVVRAQCREEAKTGGLKGDARKQAMADCIVKQRPDMEARMKCQMDPSLKSMDKDARRVAIKACVEKSKS
jgi:psiF repeat